MVSAIGVQTLVAGQAVSSHNKPSACRLALITASSALVLIADHSLLCALWLLCAACTAGSPEACHMQMLVRPACHVCEGSSAC